MAWRRLTAAIAAALLLALVPTFFLASNGCREKSGPPLFEGARPFELDSGRAGATPTAQDLERLVEAVLQVSGGAARLQRLAWRRVEDLYLSRSGNLLGNNVLCTTRVRWDESVLTLLEYSDGTNERRARLKGEEWLQPRSMTANPEGDPAVAMRLATGGSQQYVEWDWELARLPYLLAEAASLTPLPTRIDRGRTLVGMQVDVADLNPKFEAWIDLAGPAVVEVTAELPITADLALRTRAIQTQKFSDFRRVKGVLFPFRRDLIVDGARFGLAEARSIEVDVELADTDFVPR